MRVIPGEQSASPGLETKTFGNDDDFHGGKLLAQSRQKSGVSGYAADKEHPFELALPLFEQ